MSTAVLDSPTVTSTTAQADLDLAEAVLIAEQFGWTDFSRYKRSTVLHQMTTDIDGLMAFVTVFRDGTITWAVHPDEEDSTRSHRGTAASLPAAVTACSHAVASERGTLF